MQEQALKERSPEAALSPIDFEVNLLVLGYMAVVYASGSPACPQRNWGHGLAVGHSLRVGDNDFRFAKHRHERVPGLLVHVDVNKWGKGDKEAMQFFFPYDSLATVQTSIQGVRLI